IPARPSRLCLSQIPRGIMISPAKKGAGKPKNTRIPRYGLEASPRKVTGNKNNQKIVALVTTITPARLIQLLERWMSGDSQPRLRWSVFSVGMLQSDRKSHTSELQSLR